MRRVAEVAEGGWPGLWVHPEWSDRFPWVVQGTTGRGATGTAVDFGLFGATPVGEVVRHWRRLRELSGMRTTVHSRQVHGAKLASWPARLPEGMVVTDGSDAHTTRLAGILLTISVADCVPVFMVAETEGTVGIAHAGWRGVAAGVVENALANLTSGGAALDGLWLHCGPAICGDCYEVGPEVHEAVRPGEPPPPAKTPIDLPAAIAERAHRAGISPEKLTVSSHCTLCGPADFFSHRGGSPARQIAVIGIRT